MEHLGQKDVEAFWSDRLEADAVQQVARHLVSGCAPCRQLLFQTLSAEVPFEDRERPPLDAYDAAIDRALKQTRKLLPRLNEVTERRDRGLALLREKGGWSQITAPEQRSFQGAWPHVEILLQLSFDHRYRDPKEMLVLAQTAERVVERIDRWPFGENLLFDLRARVYGELGNAYRVNERYRDAETAFATARSLLHQGTGDLGIAAHLSNLEASLRSAQRRLDDALELLDEACRIYRQLGDPHLGARMLVQKGHCQRLAGRLQEAGKTLRQSLAQLDPGRDPQIVAVAQQNLLDALVDAGELTEAGRFLIESGLGHKFAGDPLNLLRLRWVEAKILAGRKRLADAERVFADVRQGFRAQGLRYVEALVGMDLALVRLRQGKEVHDLALDLYSECRAHGVSPEAVRALQSFEILARMKTATLPRVERLRDFLVQLQESPRLRFEPELLFG